jgi:comEA protein
MKINWQKEIHTGWRQACGIGLIVFALGGAGFYYTEMHSLAKGMVTINADSLNNKAVATAEPESSPSASPQVEGKVKLSTATQAELETLPGIGPSKAQAIMAYRNKYGFKSINDLTKVKGIGEKTFEQLSSQIEL